MFLFTFLLLIQKTTIIQGYIGFYRHPSGPYFMLKGEFGKLQVVFDPQGDLHSKFSNVDNDNDPTRSPDDFP